MKRLVSILSVIALWPLAISWADLGTPNEMGITMGHVHAIVRNMDAAKKFWTLMGGTPIKVDGTEVMKFPGMLLFLTPGEPSGGSDGTPVNHIGLWVADGMELLGRLKAAGVKMDPDAGITTPGFPKVANVYSSDDLKVEIMEGKKVGLVASPSRVQAVGVWLQSYPAALDHIHYAFPDPAGAQTWYAMFGATPSTYSGPTAGTANRSGNLAGTRLLYQTPRTPLVPTKGRALDRIGFEVKNLEVFCKSLAAKGVKFDEPFSKKRHKSFASAVLTDPWGTSIELTEGLSRF